MELPAASPRSSTLSLSSSRHHITASTMSLANTLTYDSLRSLAEQVVAYHVCQADNTSLVWWPSLFTVVSAYLAQAPQLSAYRDLLLQEPHVQNLLTMRQCAQNPSKALIQGILEPLNTLKRTGKITAQHGTDSYRLAQ